jgi:capsular polysaccharide transport system permease protein
MTPTNQPAPRPDLRAVEPEPAGSRPAEPEAVEPGSAAPAHDAEAAAQRAPKVAKERAAKAAPAPGPSPETPAETPAAAPPGDAHTARRAAKEKRQRKRKEARRDAATLAPAPPKAQAKPRHWIVLASFALFVLAPFLLAAGYLYTRAADQYHSEVAFSIRSEEVSTAAAGLLGAITQIGTGTASDADILFQFIGSPEIVREIDDELDLRAIYNRAEGDPVFTLGDDPSMEALLAQWARMVKTSLDANAGIIDVRAYAFTPEDSQAIAAAILHHSSDLVNRLSVQAREDAVRFAREELQEAEENLRAVRQRMAEFRSRYRIVDPTGDVAGQSGLLNALNQELAQALVDRDVLLSYASEGDQRVIQANRRIAAITARIEDERSSLDLTGLSATLTDVVGRYEELAVDLEFANAAYTQALAGLAAARGEARRQSRYLAPHIEPTLATTSIYPRRALLAGLAGLFLLLGWGVLALIFYNVRDNR